MSKFDPITSGKYQSCGTWCEEGGIGQIKVGTCIWFISICNRGCRGGWEGDVLGWSIHNYFLLHFCRIHTSVNRCYLRAVQETFSRVYCVQIYSFSAVNNSLPVHLTASNMQQNPEFAKLLTSLTRHLTESGISVTVHKDMVQVSVADIS